MYEAADIQSAIEEKQYTIVEQVLEAVKARASYYSKQLENQTFLEVYMFAKIIDNTIWCGYKMVAITEFVRVEENKLLYGQREYRLTLANGRVVNIILHQEDWQKLEGESINVHL